MNFQFNVASTAQSDSVTPKNVPASPDVAAVTIGLEDYTADLGVVKTPAGGESLYARTRLVNAARQARVRWTHWIGEFEPKDYKDEYRERVMEFVEKKAKGHKPKLRLVKSKRKAASLDKVLSKSIEALKKKAA